MTRFCYKDSIGQLKYHFEYPEVSFDHDSVLNVSHEQSRPDDDSAKETELALSC